MGEGEVKRRVGRCSARKRERRVVTDSGGGAGEEEVGRRVIIGRLRGRRDRREVTCRSFPLQSFANRGVLGSLLTRPNRCSNVVFD